MYTKEFEYYRAGSVDEAISLLGEHKGAKVLAGGHSLIPTMKLRLADPGVLIDIGRIGDLKGIKSSGDSVTIGALTTHAMVAASDKVPAAMSDAAGSSGDVQVRNRGTIGGNAAYADPAADSPTALMALGATFNITGKGGERSVAAADFFKGLFETALEDGEILTSIDIPAEKNGTGSAYAKMDHPASRYAIVGAAASVTVRGGKCEAASVAVGGLTPSATKLPSVEAALVGKELNAETIAAAAKAAQNDLGDDVMGDFHASAEYRKAMASVYVKRALTAAAERA